MRPVAAGAVAPQGPVPRGRWQGVVDILHYNRVMYALAGIVVLLGLALAAWTPWPPPARGLAGLAALGVAAVALGSLAVSHAVYDRSELHRWTWLTRRTPRVGSWAVLHAGLDEASPALERLYPSAEGHALDLYDPDRMTEPAIRVARRRRRAQDRRGTFDDLGLPTATKDLVLLFFSAHELRAEPDRIALLREAARVLAPHGRVVVVEHMRDLPNLLAFNLGALHFFPRRSWLRVMGQAGLRVVQEHTITPFVHAFHLAKEAA